MESLFNQAESVLHEHGMPKPYDKALIIAVVVIVG
jgi:hypothetical protein